MIDRSKLVGFVFHACAWLLFFVMGSKVFAADFSYEKGVKGKKDIITMTGDLEDDDHLKFNTLAVNSERAIVVFESMGGKMLPGLEIGKTIRLKGFATRTKGEGCMSACAMAWLAGSYRIVDKGAKVGFHQGFTLDDKGQASTNPYVNALIGVYLNRLGFSDNFIYFVTDADPDNMNYLTPNDANTYGVSVIFRTYDFEALNEFNKGVNATVKGVPTAESIKWYRIAAQKGFAGAQNNYGDAFEMGEAVKANEKFAIYWYTRAAERGEPTAYLSLADLLSKSTSDTVVLVEALKFANLAVNNLKEGANKNKSKELAKVIAEKITSASKDEALELSQSWEPLYQETNLIGDSLKKNMIYK